MTIQVLVAAMNQTDHSLLDKMNIKCDAIVTIPFDFEGRNCKLRAEKGVEELSRIVDALIILPCERLKFVAKEKITFANAFDMANDVLCHIIQGIAEQLCSSDILSLSFADVSCILKDAGRANIGLGSAAGSDRALSATQRAIVDLPKDEGLTALVSAMEEIIAKGPND